MFFIRFLGEKLQSIVSSIFNMMTKHCLRCFTVCALKCLQLFHFLNSKFWENELSLHLCSDKSLLWARLCSWGGLTVKSVPEVYDGTTKWNVYLYTSHFLCRSNQKRLSNQEKQGKNKILLNTKIPMFLWNFRLMCHMHKLRRKISINIFLKKWPLLSIHQWTTFWCTTKSRQRSDLNRNNI